MNRGLSHRPHIVAGLVRAFCDCCAEPQQLAPHASLDAARLACPESLEIYLDRGDGLFEQTGEHLPANGSRVEPPGDPVGQPEILSDRPRRTGPKTRIELERATFAAS
jgi:hypothetical protein